MIRYHIYFVFTILFGIFTYFVCVHILTVDGKDRFTVMRMFLPPLWCRHEHYLPHGVKLKCI